MVMAFLFALREYLPCACQLRCQQGRRMAEQVGSVDEWTSTLLSKSDPDCGHAGMWVQGGRFSFAFLGNLISQTHLYNFLRISLGNSLDFF